MRERAHVPTFAAIDAEPVAHGRELTDYIREAHRCLHIDGHLHIWEAASYFDDVKKFAAALAKLGFDVTTPNTEGAFVRIYAFKNAKKLDA